LLAISVVYSLKAFDDSIQHHEPLHRINTRDACSSVPVTYRQDSHYELNTAFSLHAEVDVLTLF